MNWSKGFTLAEMAVAVVILALLLFGAMVPFSAQVEIRNVAETRRTMDSIKDAIIGFAQANGRLPCPADGSIAAGAPNAGTEQFNGTSCVAGFTFGVIPWVTLGVAETDAWGRRFSYRVSPAFADSVYLPSPPNPPGTPQPTWNTLATAYLTPPPPPTYLAQNIPLPAPPSPQNQAPLCDLTSAPTLSSFALCTLGDIAVFTRTPLATATAAVPLGTALPAVFISHGKNGLGAWQTSGIRLPLPVAGTDEAANVNGNVQATPLPSPPGYASWAFYSRSPTPASAGCADPTPPATSAAPLCEFDDTVVMISSNTIIARMVAAGRLP